MGDEYDRAQADFWADLGRRPPAPPTPWADDWFNHILYDAAAIQRGVMSMDKASLQREIDRHRAKLERAEARLEALRGIPERDPFADGTVFRVDRRVNPSGTTWTFAVLRAGGHWYTTGRSAVGLIRADWHGLVNWLLEGGVSAVEILDGSRLTPLSELPEGPVDDEPEAKTPGTVTLPVRACDYTTQEDHQPHIWGVDERRPWFWCDGR